MGFEPYPEAFVTAQPRAAPGPHARHSLAAALRLGFVAALQRLPPEERAALLLRDVLGYGEPEAAAMLGVPEARVAELIAGARDALGAVRPPPVDRARERIVVARFAAAFAAGADAGALLAPGARLTVVPDTVVDGAAVAAWLRTHAPATLTPGRAGGQPAFGCRSPDGVLVLETASGGVAALTWFGDPDLAARLGLG